MFVPPFHLLDDLASGDRVPAGHLPHVQLVCRVPAVRWVVDDVSEVFELAHPSVILDGRRELLVRPHRVVSQDSDDIKEEVKVYT